MSYRTDYARAHGWGSAHDGTRHFTLQRLTALALIPLTFLFIFPFARALGAGYEEARAIYSNGWNALVAVNFLILGFWHLKLGIQVIFEDYVPGKVAKPISLLANIFFNWALGAAGVFAVLMVAFSG